MCFLQYKFAFGRAADSRGSRISATHATWTQSYSASTTRPSSSPTSVTGNISSMSIGKKEFPEELLLGELKEWSWIKHICYCVRSHGTRGAIAEELAAVVRALWSGQYRFIAAKDLRVTYNMTLHSFHTPFPVTANVGSMETKFRFVRKISTYTRTFMRK